MKSELIVDVRPDEVSIALLEDSRLVSLQKEQRNISYAVGDIYLARVRKLMPGLNAAFVHVGYEKDAFLHYLDLGPHFATYDEFVRTLLADRKHIPSLSRMKLKPDIDKHGSITDLLEPGRELLVQIVKEPISSKGPRLTTEITFTGRYLVLIPFSDKISVSQKIKTTEEKLRLRQLIESIKPKNFGVIVRTSAEGKRVAELNQELETLRKCWEATIAKAQRVTAPALIFEEESRIVAMLRDVFSPSFENIWVNDADTCQQIEKYVKLIAPDSKGIVSHYDKDEPIFDRFGITRQIKSSFGKTVSFRSGAYIIIEHTEALHVIDVNSGNRSKGATDQESNALDVNIRAADEIARQLRLRDMGGIIVIDFIDMYKAEHRQQLYEHMREVMSNDRARHNILPLSKFGLMQITRQRVRPVLDIATTETCPSCFGKGEVQPSLLFTDTLYEKLDYLVNTLQAEDFVMYVHPYVEAYIKRGLFTSLYGKWRRHLGRKFKVMADESLAYLQYRVLDKDRNELVLKTEKDLNESTVDKSRNKARNRGQLVIEEANVESDDAPAAVGTDQPEAPEAPEHESASKKRRRRRRRAKEAAAAEAAAAADTQPTAESEPEPEAKPEPKTEATTETAAPADDATPKPQRKPRKPRNPKPAEPADAAGTTDLPSTTAAEPAQASDTPSAEANATDSVAEPAERPSKPRRRSRRRPAAADGAPTDATASPQLPAEQSKSPETTGSDA